MAEVDLAEVDLAEAVAPHTADSLLFPRLGNLCLKDYPRQLPYRYPRLGSRGRGLRRPQRRERNPKNNCASSPILGPIR